MAVRKIVETKDEVSQEIDLKEALNTDDPAIVEAAAQELIDNMVDRVKSGKGKSGKS